MPPGRPNKPPDLDPAPPPVPQTPPERLLRRIAPLRVALRHEMFKGGPPAEMVEPFARAEAAAAAGQLESAESELDRLSVRLAEPRWPTLPEPWRSLRVPIPTPQPPAWDPDSTLSADEREARRGQRYALLQLSLATASVECERARGTPVDDLVPTLAAAKTACESKDAASFWPAIDAVWSALRARVPAPVARGARPGPPAPAAPAEASA